MKKIILFALLAIVFTSCEQAIEGNGNVKEETREAAPFDKINVSGSFDIHIKPGNYSSVVVVTDQNLLEHIETYVKGGTLHVEPKKKLGHYQKLELLLTMNEFNGADISGSCELNSKGKLNGKKVRIDLAGNNKAELDISCKDLEVDMSGSSRLNIKGDSKKASFDISGSGTVEAEEFQTETTDLDVSGSAEALVNATEELNVDVSGSAQVRYAGNPGKVNQEVSGSATVKPL